MKRRHVLASLFLAPLTALSITKSKKSNFIAKLFQSKDSFRFVRPPGAKAELAFNLQCIRCRACANVCEAGCIRFFSFSENPLKVGTPYVNTRLRACNLCMNCTQVCPTGALNPIERLLTDIKKEVRMGVAEVIESACLSFNGRICGVCHDACPLSGEAIVLVPKAKPEVITDVCIGCGRCEERCPQYPAAIIVRPPKDLEVV